MPPRHGASQQQQQPTRQAQHGDNAATAALPAEAATGTAAASPPGHLPEDGKWLQPSRLAGQQQQQWHQTGARQVQGHQRQGATAPWHTLQPMTHLQQPGAAVTSSCATASCGRGNEQQQQQQQQQPPPQHRPRQEARTMDTLEREAVAEQVDILLQEKEVLITRLTQLNDEAEAARFESSQSSQDELSKVSLDLGLLNLQLEPLLAWLSLSTAHPEGHLLHLPSAVPAPRIGGSNGDACVSSCAEMYEAAGAESRAAHAAAELSAQEEADKAQAAAAAEKKRAKRQAAKKKKGRVGATGAGAGPGTAASGVGTPAGGSAARDFEQPAVVSTCVSHSPQRPSGIAAASAAAAALPSCSLSTRPIALHIHPTTTSQPQQAAYQPSSAPPATPQHTLPLVLGAAAAAAAWRAAASVVPPVPCGVRVLGTAITGFGQPVKQLAGRESPALLSVQPASTVAAAPHGPVATGQQRQPQQQQRQQQPQQQAASDAAECVVCLERSRSNLLLPCRHLALCGACCEAIRAASNECPVCRATIQASVAILQS